MDMKEVNQKLLKRAPWIWIRNERGEKSASLTLAVIAFLVCTMWVGLSVIEEYKDWKFRPFDPAVAAAYLTPVLGLYGWRRSTRVKEDVEAKKAGGGGVIDQS